MKLCKVQQNSVVFNFQTSQPFGPFQNKSEYVCDIVTIGNQSEYSELVKTYFLHKVDAISDLLRFDKNQSTTNEYDSYRTNITGLEDTMFSVPLSGIYEIQFR